MSNAQDFLVEIIDFLDNYVDADYVEGSYQPNRAMRLSNAAEALLEQIEREQKPVSTEQAS